MAGYLHCACRDCMEITVGTAPEFCADCVEAGCEADHEGEGECRSPLAYGSDCGEPARAE